MHLIIFITVFVYLVGFGFIIPFIPTMSQAFGATPVQIGFLFAAFSAMQFMFSPFWGRLSDRWGRKPVLLICLVGEGVSYIIFGLAESLALLFVARALSGFFGASISTASAIISDITGPKERSRGMAIIGMAFGLGFVVGPSLGGMLLIGAEKWGLPPVPFATGFVAVICFVNTIFAWRMLPETLKESTRTANQTKFRESRIALLRKFLVRPVSREVLLAAFLLIAAMASMESNLILYLGLKFGWTIKEVSFGFAYVGIVGAIWQGGVVRRLLPRFGEKTLLFVGMVLYAIGLLSIPLSPSVAVLGAVMTVFSMGHGFINPCLQGVFSLLNPESEQGESFGILQSSMSLARIAGPLVGGWAYQAIDPSAPFFISSGLAVLALFTIYTVSPGIKSAGKSVAI